MPPTSMAITAPAATTRSPRALVIRSCRPHVFARAVAEFRTQHPAMQLDALSHAGHRDSIAACGIDDVIEVPGTRFGWLRLPLAVVTELRSRSYAVVLVPVMSMPLSHHLNLMLMAMMIGAGRIAVFAPGGELNTSSRTGVLGTIASEWRQWLLHFFDLPLALLLMSAALFMPRRRSATASRKRVLHIITSWGVGGAQRQLAEVLQRSPASRVDAEVFVLASADGDFSNGHLRGFDVRIRYAHAWPQLTPTILEIAALCKRERYDVVHTWLFLANVLGVTAARLARAPRVISSVRNLSLWKRTWANQWWFRLADALSSRAADVVTVNGTSLAQDHAQWARMRASRIAVVPNGLATIDLDLDCEAAGDRLRHGLTLPHHVRIVGTVGRLAAEKDHATLIDAWHTVQPEHAQLVIVGDGPLRNALTRRAAGDPSISFMGESDRAREAIAGFDLFVLPSIIEGFPNVLLEAAMIGVPVLATDVGASRDVVVDDADLIPSGDVFALATALRSQLSALDAARTRADRRRTMTRRTFTIDRSVDRWLSLYDGANR